MNLMLDELREGDTVVVWMLDRLSRSLKDVLQSWSGSPRLVPAFDR